MNASMLMVWSMALGAIAAITVARLGDFLARPALSRLRAVSYHFSVFLLVLVLSGLAAHANPAAAARLQVLQVLAGPLCVGLSNFWIHGWLRAAERDRLMAVGLRASALVLPLLAVLALLLPASHQLPAAAAISLAGGGLTLWLTLRGWLMGDRLALAMAAGCVLTLPAIAGLYALAMEIAPRGLAAQALLAAAAVLSNGLTGLVLWRRDRRIWRARRRWAARRLLDPLTRLAGGRTVVRDLLRVLRRRRRSGRHGAVLAVLVFDVERLLPQIGSAGVNEMWLALAARIERQAGIVNPVGRYWDHCFVCVVETIPSPAWLRTLGLQLAGSVRQPLEVNGPGGGPVRFQADAAVGVVHLPPGRLEVEDVLDEAQRMAAAARHFRSRAAIADPASGEAVPVEEAVVAAPAAPRFPLLQRAWR